jgi:hypothetical protein
MRMKVTLELTLEEALEYLRLIGRTSQYDRRKFFEQHAITPRVFPSPDGRNDVLGCIFFKISDQLKDLVSEDIQVVTGYQMGDIVITDKKIAEQVGHEKEVLVIIRR